MHLKKTTTQSDSVFLLEWIHCCLVTNFTCFIPEFAFFLSYFKLIKKFNCYWNTSRNIVFNVNPDQSVCLSLTFVLSVVYSFFSSITDTNVHLLWKWRRTNVSVEFKLLIICGLVCFTDRDVTTPQIYSLVSMRWTWCR